MPPSSALSALPSRNVSRCRSLPSTLYDTKGSKFGYMLPFFSGRAFVSLKESSLGERFLLSSFHPPSPTRLRMSEEALQQELIIEFREMYVHRSHFTCRLTRPPSMRSQYIDWLGIASKCKSSYMHTSAQCSSSAQHQRFTFTTSSSRSRPKSTKYGLPSFLGPS